MKYRAEIDGLRALAVAPVILFHAGVPGFAGGYVGVDVFFVISGYLISSIILEDMDKGRFSLAQFYERRARRILPALFFVLLLALPFAYAWLMPPDLKAFAQSVFAVLTFTSNFLFWAEAGYFDTAAELKPLLHTWSLAVEEQYYILFPLILMALGLAPRRVLVWVILALFALSFAVAIWAVPRHPMASFFLLPARGWELLLGVFATLWLRRGLPDLPASMTDILALIGLTLILLPVFLYDATTPFPGLAALPPTLGTALLILFAQRPGRIAGLLGRRIFVWPGLLSYSAYLWHQPVFAFTRHRFGQASFEDLAPLLILLSFAMAFFSYRFVERPFRRGLPFRPMFWALSTSVVLLLAGGTALRTLVEENPDALPAYVWALENADPALLAYAQREGTRRPCAAPDDLGIESCRFGDPDAPETLVLWGDSFAGALLHGLHETAAEAGLAGRALITNGCPPLPGLTNSMMAGCGADTHEAVLDHITGLPDAQTVLVYGNLVEVLTARNLSLEGAPATPETMRAALARARRTLNDAGQRLTLIEPGPAFPVPVATHLIQSLRRPEAEPLMVPRADHEARLTPVAALAPVVDLYLGTVDLFCPGTTCPAQDDTGTLVMHDRNHVTPPWSRILARHVLRQADLVPTTARD